MRAYVLHGIGDFGLEDIPTPKSRQNYVLVKVMAAGICGSDIPRIFYTGAHRHPLVPGHEFAGQVVGLGEGVDSSWLHKNVGVFPLIPCGKCLSCQKKQYEMCKNYNYLGSRCDGGFAEYVEVPVWNLIELPDNVTYEEAAMMEPMAVAVHAMRRVAPRKEDTVAVCGLGTIGLLLVMFLKEAGIENVLAIGNKDFQRDNALKLGVAEEDYCDSRENDVMKWLLDKTNGNGVHTFFECVGKNETVSLAIDSTMAAGSVCFVGNPYSDMVLEKNVYWKILRNQLNVTGTWNSSFTGDASDDWHYVLGCLAAEKIHPKNLISHKFSLEDFINGFYIMKDKSEDYVKIMMSLE